MDPMKTLITAAILTLASTTLLAAEPQMTNADWAALHSLSRIAPAKHIAVLHVANECHVVPNTDALLGLLSAPIVVGMTADVAVGRLPQVTPQVCESLAKH
jgi:hypothetical protein